MDLFECGKCKSTYGAVSQSGNCPFCGTPTLRIPITKPEKKICFSCNKEYPLEIEKCICGRPLFIIAVFVGWKDEIKVDMPEIVVAVPKEEKVLVPA